MRLQLYLVLALECSVCRQVLIPDSERDSYIKLFGIDYSSDKVCPACSQLVEKPSHWYKKRRAKWLEEMMKKYETG